MEVGGGKILRPLIPTPMDPLFTIEPCYTHEESSRPKECGGLGIHNLELQNKCLLSKWVYKLINEEGVWQNLLMKKYLAKKCITQVDKQPGDSHFWSGLMAVKESFFSCGSFEVHNVPRRTFIWNLSIPLKIKIFLWYLWRGITLTKDNLAKRKWKGSIKCCFCNSNETIQHLFFDCHLVIFKGTYWAQQWSLLLKEEDGHKLNEYCKMLEVRVIELYAKYG
uniref:OSJNBb0032D24.9 protein n=1 Tax=Oryza sativa subsp. japonica TaxID=39947 RepID=Q7XNI4_ORYSJ|nr:OSJNBb0032D24.9 [Oryza sativa Japonica Group]